MLYTDDMTVRVARGETLVSLVDYLLESEQTRTAWANRLEVLIERFALSFDDARLAIDRVAGGRVRAANPINVPDRNKDPIAWISYRRHRGEAVPVEATPPSSDEEGEAAALWHRAANGDGDAQGTTSVPVALLLFDLTAAAMSEDSNNPRKRRLLIQAATAVSTAAEACIDSLGDRPCAQEGTQPWVDGVRLAGCARHLAAVLASLGAPEMEHRALDLQGRIVTRMLGQCHARVGRAMLDSAQCALRMGDRARVAFLCEAVAADFARLVDEWEASTDAPFDEHRLALEYLLVALDLLARTSDAPGELPSPRRELRARCAAVLARQVATQ